MAAGIFQRFISARRVKSHTTSIILSLSIILFVWFLVFATNKKTTFDIIQDNKVNNNNNINEDNQALSEYKNPSTSQDIINAEKLADELLEDLDLEKPKETEDLIFIDDEVVDIDEGGGVLTDNVFQNIVNKISEFDPKVTVPFASTFAEADTTTDLKSDSLGYYIEKSRNIGGNPDEWDNTLSMDALANNYLILNEKIEDNITKSHKGFIDLVASGKFEYPDFYHGNGIVITGGGEYSLQAFSVISVIRTAGTSLPIEVLIPSDYEQDEAFCNKLETDFVDCKCIYLDEIFDKSYLKTHEFHAFQYKSLALMASSFQNVLLLDADDYPLKNIDDIFDHPAFENTGMIVWPDFWRRTTHPFYYESAGLKIDLQKRVRNFYTGIIKSKQLVSEEDAKRIPYHDFAGALPDPSSETGEFLIDKKKHWKSLILSLYYNVHGPNVFYHLFTQYAAGQGDKETFLAAAHVLDLPYYQVFVRPSLDSYFEPKEDARRSVAYYQKDYRKDYEIKQGLVESAYEGDISSHFDAEQSESVSLFAHCNLPKFDALKMTEKGDFTEAETGKHFRALTQKTCLQGLDLEKIITESYYKELCKKDQSLNVFNYLIEKDFDNICSYWKARADIVETTTV